MERPLASEAHASSRDLALERPERVALVLGAGGPVGFAFHAGVLEALRLETGFEPQDAHLIVGTSAGAQVGAMVRAGLSSSDLYAKSMGMPMSEAGAAIAARFRRPDFGAPRRWGWPASPRYLWSALTRPWRVRPGLLVASALPEGQVDLTTMATGLRELFGEQWPQAGLWICAADVDSGQRVVFGQAGAPNTDVGSAVAASCAVPSLTRPFEIGAARYIDGAMVSTSNADVVLGADIDRVVISSPLSRLIGFRGVVRRWAARIMASGLNVDVLEPQGKLHQVMGYNFMKTDRAPAVARETREFFRRAYRTGDKRPMPR